VGADDVTPLLDRFTADVGRVLPLVAVWAHGSLALGDFQPGRSDFDLVALIGAAVTSGQREKLQRMHEALLAELPLADQVHCVYVVRAELADPARVHLTWAHGELFDRILSPVSRRELRQGGLCLFGPPPAGVVPALTDAELADYIRADLRDFWYPHTGVRRLWQNHIWVDLGLLVLARAGVTLRDGRLITKREALTELADLGAPADVLRDIYQRRYETAPPMSAQWRDRRGLLARTFVRAGIERLLALPRLLGDRLLVGQEPGASLGQQRQVPRRQLQGLEESPDAPPDRARARRGPRRAGGGPGTPAGRTGVGGQLAE